MISPKSHGKDWIKEVTQKQFPKTDPSLAERVIYALTLLEKLKGAGIDFVFKGGTALLLSMADLHRFSIDIDVVMPTKPADLEARFADIVKSGIFKRYAEDVRENRLGVKKGHYRFYFDSVILAEPPYILLDIIFDKPTYLETRLLPLTSPFVQVEGSSLEIMVPSLEGLMSDKLTTLAAETVGIAFGKGNELQIAKQLYDVARLFDRVSDIAKVRAELEKLVPVEAGYKKLGDPGVRAILEDCFDLALAVGLRGKYKPERHKEIRTGVARLGSYLLKKGSPDDVLMWAGKVAYASRLLVAETGEAIERFDAAVDMTAWSIVDQRYNQLNKISKMSPEGFFYWYHSIRVIAGTEAVTKAN